LTVSCEQGLLFPFVAYRAKRLQKMSPQLEKLAKVCICCSKL